MTGSPMIPSGIWVGDQRGYHRAQPAGASPGSQLALSLPVGLRLRRFYSRW